MATAAAHCRPGGVVLMAPDYVRERSGPGRARRARWQRSARYLEWTWDPTPPIPATSPTTLFTLRGADGTMRAEHDRHVEGLFPRGTWLRLLAEAGVDAEAMPLEHSEVEAGITEVFIGRKLR